MKVLFYASLLLLPFGPQNYFESCILMYLFRTQERKDIQILKLTPFSNK
jgi:hypothetical protein